MNKKLIISIIFSILASTSLLAQNTFDVNGQVRPRLQIDGKDFDGDTGMNSFTELRTRLGVKFTPTSDVTGFIQVQDSRHYGSESSSLSDSKNIDLHQGYVAVKNIFKLPVDLQMGRMELAFANQRLIGSVGWHNVGRSFDGSVLNLNTKKISIGFVSVKAFESGNFGDTSDVHVYAVLGNLKMVKNMKIQPFLVAETSIEEEFSRYTLGAYLAGKIGGLSHEIEAAYQMGSATADIDFAAFMFALNLKYGLKSAIKPTVSAGIDYLSGDDGEDATKSKVFSTLFATNHKFYGFMDYFLNIPVNTHGLGLMDIHGKVSIAPCDKSVIALAFHMFNANADFTLIDGTTSTSFGSEIDLTVTHKYNDAVKFVGGFSMFSPGDIFKQTKGEDSANWAYLMAVVNL
ncbi:MAG: alginate export family protein [Ignavibacteriae bacterium]|nr:alginate export family protein [Ignavibacteriota bacterium]